MNANDLKALTAEARKAESRKQAEKAAWEENYQQRCQKLIIAQIPDQITKFEVALAAAATAGGDTCKYAVPYTINNHEDHWDIVRNALVDYCIQNKLEHTVQSHRVEEYEWWGDDDMRKSGKTHPEYDITVRW